MTGGSFGEVVMMPGMPRLSFDKLLLFGAGERKRFDEASFTVLLRKIVDATEGLGDTGGSELHDAWTLVEI